MKKITYIFQKRLELNRAQTQTLIHILVGMGHVCAAGIVVPYFVDRFEITKLLFGLLFMHFFLIMALCFSRGIHDDYYR